MKVENGKKYETEVDGLVRLICTDAEGDFPIVVLAKVPREGSEFPRKYKLDGTIPGMPSQYFLRELVEPVKRWVNLRRFPDGSLGLYLYLSDSEARGKTQTGEDSITVAFPVEIPIGYGLGGPSVPKQQGGAK